ncbi:hypothetical protein CUJ90_19720 [Paraburkholderia terricola]|jgi:hypothetical protein|nr:hypothetical protein CUJ90_19720 [Paraburkholderia terricola]
MEHIRGLHVVLKPVESFNSAIMRYRTDSVHRRAVDGLVGNVQFIVRARAQFLPGRIPYDVQIPASGPRRTLSSQFFRKVKKAFDKPNQADLAQS